MSHLTGKFLILLVSVFLVASNAHAVTNNVIFVNGINNTLEQAWLSVDKIYDVLQKSANHPVPRRKTFAVIAIWNPIGFYGRSDGEWNLSQDQKELFVQKTAEEHFASSLQRILVPVYEPPRTIERSAASNVAQYYYNMLPGSNSLEDEGEIDADAIYASKKAVTELINRIKARQPAIVVSHSQGNLLANLAFAKLAADYGDDVYQLVRVVNVANTSLYAVSNLNLTHDRDALIFSAATDRFDLDKSIETLPKRQGWTRTVDGYCYADKCPFQVQQPSFGGSASKAGFFEHEFIKTYLSTDNLPNILSGPFIFTPNKNRFVDRFEDLVYTAAETLEFAVRPDTVKFIGRGKVSGIDDANRLLRNAFSSSFAIGTNVTVELVFNPDAKNIPIFSGANMFPIISAGVKVGGNAELVAFTRMAPWYGATIVAALDSSSKFSFFSQSGGKIKCLSTGCVTWQLDTLLANGSLPYGSIDVLPYSPPNPSQFPGDYYSRNITIYVSDENGKVSALRATFDTFVRQ